MASDGQVIIDVELNTGELTRGVNALRTQLGGINANNITNSFRQLSTQLNQTNTQLDTQRQKLQQLRTQLNNSTNIDERNGIRTQIRSTETEITRLQENYNNLSREAINDLQRMNSEHGRLRSAASNTNITLSDSVSKMGKSISSVGNTLSTSVTLPIVGLGVAAAKAGMDFDSSMSRVKAISGATGDEFKQLHDQALQLGKDTAFSAKEAATGMEGLAAAGFSTQETMAAMPGLLDLAAASGESLATSTDIAASTLRGFGLEANQAGHVADVLAKNANATNAAVADTGEAMKFIAPVAHSMGLSLEEVTAAIGELANSGVQGSMAGTTLRSALTRLASPAKEAKDAMASIGFSAFDSQGKLKGFSTIIDEYNKALQGKTDQQKQDLTATIFGQEAMSGMLVLMQGGKKGLDDLTDSYKSADGAAKDMATTMQDNSKSAIEQMTGSIETAAIKLEEVAAPSITKIANEIQDMANAFADLDPQTQEFIIKAALAAAAVGPLVKTVGALGEGLGGLLKFGKGVGTALGLIGTGAEGGAAALGGFTLAGGLAIGAVSALAIGIAGAVTYNNLLGKSVDTSTDDLNAWEKAVNACTGGTIKSKEELQKAGLIYKDFGDNVSDSFKDGIEKATKQYHDFEMTLTGANSDDKMSSENQSKIKGQIDAIINSAKSAINSRKSEVQNELSEMFVAGDGTIDANEQKVIDAVGGEADAKLQKISEIQGQISEVWTKAIANHGKLSQEDIDKLKSYITQVKQIQAEVEAKNEAESDYAKNDFSERLSGVSLADASSLYKDASDEVKKKFEKERAVYKTGLNELQSEIKKFNDEGKTEEAKAAQDQYNAKDKEYKDSLKKEQDYLKDYRDMLYKKNPALENDMNIVDGSKLSTKDKDQFEKLKTDFLSKYDDIATATESGMKRVKDANGKWHDVYVEVDQATGQILSAYDTFNGNYAGYSAKFADNAKSTGDKIKEAMENLHQALTPNGGGIKLDVNNNVINASTDQTIEKLDNVIKKADGTKVAIQNINGTKIKLEFDEDGALKNAGDVQDAIEGKFKDNPAVIQTKVTIDGQEADSTTEDIIKKLNDIKESNPNAKISINGEELPTIDDAIKKLGEIPPDTNTDVVVNTNDANSKIDETSGKADDLGNKQPNVTATADTQQADNNLDTTNQKTDDLNGKQANATVNVDTGNSLSLLDRIKSFLEWISGKSVSANVNVNQEGTQTNYTGTTTLKTGLSHVNEHGWETSNNNNVKMLSNGLAFLIGNHYTGGDGINDHMTSVNEMHNDVSNKVNESVGQIVNALISSLSSQGIKLNQIATNTAETVNTAKEGNKLNEDLAKNIVSQYKTSTTGSFSSLNTEIEMANKAKENADNMKVEDNSNYSQAKSKLDDLESQIDDIKDKSEQATDESVKKQLQAQQKELEKQKDVAQKESDLAKEVAQNEIEQAKKSAEEQVKIAEDKKDKLAKIAEATTTAIKNEYEAQKKADEDAINADLKTLETKYNNKVKKIESDLKSKTDKIDKQIKDLEKQSTDNSRDQERAESNDNINKLTTMMNNTASAADKRSLQLQIDEAKKSLQEKEDTWNIEDQKQALEDEKSLLNERADNRKKSLEEQYNKEKEAKEKELKDTDAYYDKLLQEDSVNARARYLLLEGNQNELVELLNSYNPQWQDAGQSLADSLLSGLNSKKETISQAVNEMIMLRTGSTYGSESKKTGYASGTSYNPSSGYYLTNEKGWETSDSGDVAYVSQGASIKNHMQSIADMKAEISKQLSNDLPYITSQLNATMQAEQAETRRMISNVVNNTTSNSQSVQYDGSNNFKIKNLILQNQQDVEQFFNEAESIRTSKRPF